MINRENVHRPHNFLNRPRRNRYRQREKNKAVSRNNNQQGLNNKSATFYGLLRWILYVKETEAILA